MNPLQLTPPQWRILRYLGTYSASAARVGFQAKQLCERTGTGRDDFGDLADAGYIAGRVRGDLSEPTPSIAITARAHPKLQIHITPSGKKAAATLDAAVFALLHLRVHGPLPTDMLQYEVGTPDETLAQLEHGGFTTTTTGAYIAWREGRTVCVYQAQTSAGPVDGYTCRGCVQFPQAGAPVWISNKNGPGDRYCDTCARRKCKAPPYPLIALASLGRRYSDPYMIEVGS